MSSAEQEIVDLSIDDIKVGLEFDSYNQALASILNWSQTNFIPLIKRSTRTGNLGSGGTTGRIQLCCTHGLKKKSQATEARPVQRVNYTACPARILINQQYSSRKLKVTAACNDHDGHLIYLIIGRAHDGSQND